MFNKKVISIFSLSFLGLLLYTKPAFAATLSLSPGSGNINQGSTLNVQVKLNAGGDAVNAVSAFLTYSADKLDVAYVSYSSSAFGIEAENTYGGGSIRISRGSVSPISGNATVATIGFRGKTLGNASVSFAAGSAAPRASDSSDSLSLAGSGGGSYSVVEAPPEPPKDTTAPKISGISVVDTSTTSATITWKTDEKADSYIEYGLEKDKYFLNVSNGDLVTEHSLKLEGPVLVAGTKFHYRIKSKDAAGNQVVGDDGVFQLKGFKVIVKAVDNNNKPLVGIKVLLYSDPLEEVTNSKGEASFDNVAPGKHLVLIKSNNAEKTNEITVTASSVPQVTTINVGAPLIESSQQGNIFSNLAVYAVVIVLGIIIGVLYYFLKIKRKTPSNTSNSSSY